MTGDETNTAPFRITVDDLLHGLRREAHAGDTSEPGAARIRALELIGKHLGTFPDRVEVTIERTDE